MSVVMGIENDFGGPVPETRLCTHNLVFRLTRYTIIFQILVFWEINFWKIFYS